MKNPLKDADELFGLEVIKYDVLGYVDNLVKIKKGKYTGELIYESQLEFINDTFYTNAPRNSPPDKLLESTEIEDNYITSFGFYQIKDLKKIPFTLGKLEKLYALYIQECNTEEIPKSIKYLKELKCLDFNTNNIKVIPKEINELKNLNYMHFPNNKIKELPYIGDLKKLEILDLIGNDITHLNEEILKIKSLKCITINGKQLDKKSIKMINKLNNRGVEIIFKP